MDIGLLDLRHGDADKIAAVDGGNGWNGDSVLWTQYLTEQQDSRRVVVIAREGERPVGYGTLIWEPRYERFRAAGVPEINNLAVDARVRRQGVASALSFEVMKTFSKKHQLDHDLHAESWFHFARVVRNALAHDFVFSFDKHALAKLPVTWGGVTITAAMDKTEITTDALNPLLSLDLVLAMLSLVEAH
jgi:GNAT superfamily N-acetyltransferase